MGTSYLHGVEVLEINNGAQPVQTVASAVVGIVGTAPNSAGAVPATLALSPAVANGSVVITGPATPAANQISVRVMTQSTASSGLAILVSGQTITINLASDSSSIPATTATQLVAALNGDSAFTALGLTAAIPGGSTGAGLVAPNPTLFLSGGAPAPFPLNTPTVLTSLSQAGALGIAGSLFSAINLIFEQADAPLIIVVRVAQGPTGDTDAQTIANVIGGVDTSGHYTGAQALAGAESVTSYRPRILCAPGFSQNMGVATQLVSIATKLRAVVIADGPNTVDQDAINYAANFGSDRLYIVDPGVQALDQNGNTVNLPASSVAVGCLVQQDNNIGFWASPSNVTVNGIIGTTRSVDFAMGDPTSRANLLNSNLVATIIRLNGFRLWGNRSTASNPAYAFLCVRRTADIIADSIIKAHLWAVDLGITKNYLNDVSASVTNYLRTLKSMGAIIDGKCWPDATLNTPTNIQAGHVFFNYDFAPSYPAERVTFQAQINNGYLTELTQ